MHAVHLQSGDVVALQKRFLESLELLKGDPADDVIRKHGQELAAELERHNHCTQQGVLKAMGELRETVAALANGLRALTEQSDVAMQIEALQTIVTTAISPTELEAGRSQIEDLIQLISKKERERAERYGVFVQELNNRIKELEPARGEKATQQNRPNLVTPAASQNDTLTAIPNGVAAREAILNAQAANHPPHLAVMHLQSLDLLNARFGQRIGDQIVLTCCQHLASNLCRENDRIFRWRGPAFVALLERDDSPAGVGREISHVCNSIACSFFGEPHRSILIPVKLASTTIAIESRLVTEIFDSIERFIVRAGRPMS